MIRPMIQHPRVIKARCHGIIEIAQKERRLHPAVVRIDRARDRTTLAGTSIQNTRREGIVVTILGIDEAEIEAENEVQNEAEDDQHPETIDAEANPSNVDETTIVPEN